MMRERIGIGSEGEEEGETKPILGGDQWGRGGVFG